MKKIVLIVAALSCSYYSVAQDFVWAKSVGGPEGERANTLVVDASGNVYTAGNFRNTVDLDPGAAVQNVTAAGESDAFITKMDASGNFVWSKSIGGTNTDSATDLVIDDSGNLYVTGFYNATIDFNTGNAADTLSTAGNRDVYLAKYDNSGNFLWSISIGATGTDEGRALATDGAGNIYLTGTFQSTVDFDPGSGTQQLAAGLTDIFIVKYDAAGNLTWAKSMGGPQTESVTDIEVDAAGNVYTTGYFQDVADFAIGSGGAPIASSGEDDIFVTKHDASGNLTWVKGIGSLLDDRGESIAVDASGNVHLTGVFGDDCDFDPGSAIANVPTNGGNDAFVLKLDSNGEYVWANGIGGSANDAGFSIDVSATGELYLTGNFRNTVDFDPGAATYDITTAGEGDIFVAQYTSNGDFDWAHGLGGTLGDWGTSAVLDGAGNLYLSGNVVGSADFDPSAGTETLTSNGEQDVYIVKWSLNSNSIADQQLVELALYPNPTQGQLNFTEVVNNVHVFDVTGKLVLADSNTAQIDLAALQQGTYLVRVETTAGVGVRKVIKH